MKSHSLFSLIPEICKKDFQRRITSQGGGGTKMGALLGVKHGKDRGLRTSIRKGSEGRIVSESNS